MNKLLTKVAKLVLGLSLAAGVGVVISGNKAVRVSADSTTFTASSDGASGTSHTKGTITLSTTSGSFSSSDYRCYKGATVTVSCSNGNINSLAFTFSSGSYNGGWNGSTASYSVSNLNTASWSKDCTSGSSGKQARITELVVTYTTSGGTATKGTLTINDPGSIIEGSTGTFGYTLSGGSQSSLSTQSWSSSNTNVISITNASTGAYSAVGVGNATITLTGTDASEFSYIANDGAATRNVTVSANPFSGYTKITTLSAFSVGKVYALSHDKVEFMNGTVTSKTFGLTTTANSVAFIGFEQVDGGYKVRLASQSNDVWSLNGNYIKDDGGDMSLEASASNGSIWTPTADGNTGVYLVCGSRFLAINANGDKVKTYATSNFATYPALYLYEVGQLPAITYSVSYDANGGTGTTTDPNSPYEYNASVTVVANSFTKTNCVFTEWNTAQDGSGTSYDAGDHFNITTNVILYAQWEMDTSSTYTDDTVNKVLTWNLATDSYVSASSASVTWSSNRFEMVSEKVGSTAANNYMPPAHAETRFYSTNTLTITPKGADDILRIEATASSSSYATALANSTFSNAATAQVSGNNPNLVVITAGAKGAIEITLGATSGLTQVAIHYGTFVVRTLSSIELAKNDATVQKSYYTGDVPSLTGLTVTAVYSNNDREDVTSLATITSTPSVIASDTTSISYQATYSGETSNSVVVTGLTVTTINPLQAIYSKSSGASVDVYGYFVGNKDGNNIIIMDGDYGITVYRSGCGTNDYVENETIIHVVGQVQIYHGLYEISNVTTLATVVSADVSDPVVYATAGGETYDYASRVTTVTGVPSINSTSAGDFDSAAGTNDIKIDFDLGGGHSALVFYKKATQTADTTAYSSIADAIENGDEITVGGFTAWYDGFQIQMTHLVAEDDSYTAIMFAQDLLDQTDAVCEDYDGVTNNHDALASIWSNLAGEHKYPALPHDQKTILAEASRNESGTVVEQAMARYDYLTGKYNLSNFINGRTPVQFNNPAILAAFVNNESTNTIAIIVIISLVSVTAIGGYFFIKRKEEN